MALQCICNVGFLWNRETSSDRMLSYVFADAVLKVAESGFTLLIGMFLLAFDSLLQLGTVLITGLAHCLHSQRLHRHLVTDLVFLTLHNSFTIAIQII